MYLLIEKNMLIVAQSLSHVQLFVTTWTSARQASPSFTISRSLLKLMSIESVRPSNHLILCHPLLLLLSIFPSIGIFSNELAGTSPCNAVELKSSLNSGLEEASSVNDSECFVIVLAHGLVVFFFFPLLTHTEV